MTVRFSVYAIRFLAILLAGSVGFLYPPFGEDTAHAQTTPFYQGKTISIIVGSNVGDLFDLYARLLAQYMPKYIPGNPNIIVQNMAGAASLIAANHVYNVAKPDGLTIGALYSALYFDQVIRRQEVKFDWSKFVWIGSAATLDHHLYMRADSPYKSIGDLVKASEPPKCGASGTTAAAYFVPKLLDEVIGTKFNIVTGYQTGSDIDLAIERGEVVCSARAITSFFAREPFHTWRKTGFVRSLIQTGRKRDPRLPDVPTIYELMDQYKSPEPARRLATLVLAAGAFGRPYVLPPKTPADRVNLLRQAFEKTIKDEAVLAVAENRKLEIDPNFSDELEKLAKEVVDQPPVIVGRMRQMLGK